MTRPPVASPALTLSGRGLHSGRPSTVRVTRRAEDGLGLRFGFPGFPGPLTANDLAALTRTARRATVLTDPRTGAVIRTPEHLLAAALFFATEPLDIACDAEEIPGLDGSAAPWFDLLAAACTGHREDAAAAPSSPPHRVAPGSASPPPYLSCREYDCDLTWSHAGREGTLHAEPAPRFSVRYTLERDEFGETYTLESSDAAPAEILGARTFIFWSEWKALRETAAGSGAALLQGAHEGSGLLLASSRAEYDEARARAPQLPARNFPLLHPHAFRMKHEAVRHKVLDLMGDLALNGLALPRLRLTVSGGGHALNHVLLDALYAGANTKGIPS